MYQTDAASLFKVSEVELIYKSKVQPEHRMKIISSLTAYDVFRDNWDLNKIDLLEQFKIILLDYQHNCLGISEISTGGIGACPVDPKIVFATALKARASKIICGHNHPSGHLLPSVADINLTQRLVHGGKLLDIAVLEHLIVTRYDYYSMADNGLVPQ